ncbi:MAG: PEGA domain-containing protein, partial [Acidobacteriota bacterium]
MAAILLVCLSAVGASAQRRYTITRPKERSSSETVRVRTAPRQADSRGVLVVLVEPVLPGQITVKGLDGRDLGRATADQDNGQAEFSLPLAKSYKVEVSHPGYASTTIQSRPLSRQTVVRVRLNAQWASLRLRDLPAGARILIDDLEKGVTDENGSIVVNEIPPGEHRLRVIHPDYNDFVDTFEVVEAGEEVSFGRIPLTRVARLEVEGPAGALILIDGALQGKINESGRLQILYELDQVTEHAITAELTGFQSWRMVTPLSPGPKKIRVEMSPVVTSAGVSDFFDSLNQWQAPRDWRVVGDARNKRLEVHGPEVGRLRGLIYRDLQANFTVWFGDGKGATWLVRIDPEGRSYYIFHLAGPNSTGATPRRFYTYLVRNGGEPVEVGTPAPLLADITPQTSYTINLTIRDYTIQHTITSNETGETNDLGI